VDIFGEKRNIKLYLYASTGDNWKIQKLKVDNNKINRDIA